MIYWHIQLSLYKPVDIKESIILNGNFCCSGIYHETDKTHDRGYG